MFILACPIWVHCVPKVYDMIILCLLPLYFNCYTRCEHYQIHQESYNGRVWLLFMPGKAEALIRKFMLAMLKNTARFFRMFSTNCFFFRTSCLDELLFIVHFKRADLQKEQEHLRSTVKEQGKVKSSFISSSGKFYSYNNNFICIVSE